MVQDSSSDAERQTNSLQGGKTRGEEWSWKISFIIGNSTILYILLCWCSSHPSNSVTLTLSYRLYSLLSARGIWSCHSDNVLRPTRKQTEQKYFVYWWQMPRCLTFFLLEVTNQKSNVHKAAMNHVLLASVQSINCTHTLWRDWQLQYSYIHVSNIAEETAGIAIFKMNGSLLHLESFYSLKGEFLKRLSKKKNLTSFTLQVRKWRCVFLAATSELH